MRQLFGTVSALLCAGVVAAAESPENLVKKLGSASYLEREAAGVELIKLGASALPAVKAAAESSADAEIRERAQALLDPLSRANDSSKLLAVKPVKFDGKTVPLATAIADFKQKTGIPLQLVPDLVKDSARPVVLPTGEYPPWEGLDLLLKAAGLREDFRVELPPNGQPATPSPVYSRYYDNGEQPMIYNATNAPILLRDGSPDTLSACRTGGVRIVAMPSHFSANKVILGDGRVVFHLDAAPVPSTGWNGASSVRITKAEDEEGRPVFADLKLGYDPLVNNNYYGGWNGGFGGRRMVFWNGGIMNDDSGSGNSPYHNPRLVAVAIRTNDRAIKSLRKFEGVLLGDVHTPNVPVITVDKLDMTGGSTHTGPQNSTLQIQSYKKNDNGTSSVKLRHEALTQWAIQNMKGGMGWGGNFSNNASDVLSQMKFYDADGKLLAKPVQETTSTSSDGWRQSIEVSLRFPKGTVPVRMVVTGTKVSTVEVPFKLENVSVP